MSRRHEDISFVFSSTFRDIFSQSFLRIRLQWEKTILVLCFDVIMIAFFPRNIQ